MNCILKKNHRSGFIGSHKISCPNVRNGRGACEEPTTHHVSTGYWCGNCCKRCAESIANNHRGAEVTEEIFILEVAV